MFRRSRTLAYVVDLVTAAYTEKPAMAPEVAYRAGQALARDVLAGGGNGVLYPSARYEGGMCLVALRPNLVQNIREGETWAFRWAGSAEVEILGVGAP